jgi:hypothetical protein
VLCGAPDRITLCLRQTDALRVEAFNGESVYISMRLRKTRRKTFQLPAFPRNFAAFLAFCGSLRAVTTLSGKEPVGGRIKKKENLWLSLIFSVALPAFILMKLSPENRLGPAWALVVGCSLPICYGIYDYFARNELNFFSVLGLVAILIKGTFGLFKLNPIFFACSEATLPLIFGTAVAYTARWDPTLVERFLFSPQMLDADKVRRKLALKGNVDKLRPLMVQTTLAYSGTMLLSAALNFGLARHVLKTQPHENYQKYVDEIGQFTGWQYPVIAIPLMALTIGLLLLVMKRVSDLTGVPAHQFLPGAEESTEAAVEEDG